MARVVNNGVQLPCCCVRYSLIVPAAAPTVETDAAAEELLTQIRCTGGYHPPIVQELWWGRRVQLTCHFPGTRQFCAHRQV